MSTEQNKNEDTSDLSKLIIKLDENDIVQLVSKFGDNEYRNSKISLRGARFWISEMKNKHCVGRSDRDFWAEDSNGKRVA